MSTRGSSPDWPVVDFHGHLRCGKPESAEELRRAALEIGVRRVLLLGDVLAFGFHPSPEQIRVINDDTAAAVERYPGFYEGLCHLNPEHPADFLVAETERYMRERGLKGVKLEAPYVPPGARLSVGSANAMAVLGKRRGGR